MGGIEGGWWTFTQEGYETCWNCSGTGKEKNDSSKKCHICDGLGIIYDDDDDDE